MTLGLVLKLLVTAVAGTAVVAPVSYLASSGAFSSSQSLTLENGEKCLYFPIKNGETNNKLFICHKKDNEKPIFKWWTKDSSGDGMQDIETLSWNKKSETANSTNDYLNYELEVTLKQGTSDQKTITEKGRDDYITGDTIKQLEKNCTFKSAEKNRFILLCQGETLNREKGHEITVNSYQ